jgi:SAM-dependent methyltransferase
MSPQVLRHVATIALSVLAVVVVTSQCRKPAGWLGRLLARNMNARHAGVTAWGLGHVPLESSFTVLDVGCGGGATIRRLAEAVPDGKVYGIDYSAASVDVARRVNARRIEEGRVDIRQGTVSRLPFPDGTFDFVSAVETHYYWPDLSRDLREILRTLKPGGRVAIIAETYRGSRLDALYRPAMSLLRATYLSVKEAGFADVEVAEERRKGWICAVGRKPLTEERG